MSGRQMVGAIRGQARSAGEAFGLASHVRGGRWEHWGELPFGYDVALLEACSQAAPSTAARLHHEFSRDLDVSAGRAGDWSRSGGACRLAAGVITGGQLCVTAVI
ncbi:hypothetical protein ACN6K8_004374 [[Kitasatospora] papulosa]|uniref:hypothetical protein n=1 Tax=[Kitasatospora] papulosa TaxID=1464011 RepID=UPI00403C2252